MNVFKKLRQAVVKATTSIKNAFTRDKSQTTTEQFKQQYKKTTKPQHKTENEHITNVMSKIDVANANRLRKAVVASGGTPSDLANIRNTKWGTYNLNYWLSNYVKGRADTHNVAAIMLLTLDSTVWSKISDMRKPEDAVAYFEAHMKKKRRFYSGNLWDAAQMKKTSDQIASGIALDEWSQQTTNAFFAAMNKVGFELSGVTAHKPG